MIEHQASSDVKNTKMDADQASSAVQIIKVFDLIKKKQLITDINSQVAMGYKMDGDQAYSDAKYIKMDGDQASIDAENIKVIDFIKNYLINDINVQVAKGFNLGADQAYVDAQNIKVFDLIKKKII